MGVNKQHGFTIVEISLFLAVSGMLFFTLMAGITLAIQRQRFSDSVNSTQSFLQQQYNETQTTVNDRSTDACGATGTSRGNSDCLVLGKIVDLKVESNPNSDDRINSYNVTANATLPNDASTLDEIDLLNQLNPTAVKDTKNDQEYLVAWGAKINVLKDSAGDTNPAGGSDVRYLLMLRSPTSGLIHTYKLSTTGDIFSTNDTEDLTGKIEDFSGSVDRSVKACIVSSDIVGVQALLKVEQTGSQDGITTQFDTQEARQWCGG